VKFRTFAEAREFVHTLGLANYIEWRGYCKSGKNQPVLVQSCHILVNNDGSLTSQGNHALHCVKSAIMLGGDASSWVGVPLSAVLNGLSMLAPPKGCDGIVNMSGFSQLGNIGSLNSVIHLLP
jgi:hypothetical protein